MDTGFKSVRNLPLRLAWLLLILVLASSAGIGKTLASYISSDSASDAAQVARLSVNADFFTIRLDEIVKPGDRRSYAFTVGSRSEVSMRYMLSVTLNGSMPLECVLTAGGRTVLTTTLEELRAQLAAGAALTKTGAAIDAAPNSGETACTLTVTWPETENDLEYANNAASELTVRLQAVQVD